MACLGTSLEGTYDLVPPPELAGWGFKRLRRGLKKVGRVAKKGVKAGVKVHKTVHKISMKPVKLAVKAGKFALKAAAKLAAKPIVYAFRKLAGRRAGYLAYKATGQTRPDAAAKKAAAGWALNKVNRAGPIGKLAVRILKFVDAHKMAGVGVGQLERSWKQDAAVCGMTGAEIAAAAVTIVASMAKIMKSLNKPGEAPSNPAAAVAAEKVEPVTEETQPVIEAAEETEEGAETEDGSESAGVGIDDNDLLGFFRRSRIAKQMAARNRRKAMLRRAVARGRLRRMGRMAAPTRPAKRRGF